MTRRYGSVKIGTFLGVSVAIVFVIAGAVIIASVNRSMRQQALVEAEAKMRIMLDHNMAVHTYFSHVLKPNLFEWTEPFRPDDYFDPSWMSSSYAVREMEKYFDVLSSADYYYKDAVINARNPENEADADEQAFIMELKTNPSLEMSSAVRMIDGKPYLVVMRPGEVMDASCLRCHSDPDQAPQDLVRQYGPERSFHREAELGNVASAISVRVPLEVAYAEADQVSMQLSALLLALLGLLFGAQYWLSRRLVFRPLAAIRDVALRVSGDSAHLGQEMPLPFGRELRELTTAFNVMSAGLRHNQDHLEERVRERVIDLKKANEQLEREMVERHLAEEELRDSELRFRQIYQHTRVGITRVSLDSIIEDANPAYCQMLGYPLEELVGKHLSEITHPEFIEDNLRQQAQLARGELDHYQMEKSYIHRQGHTVYGILDATLIRDAAGNPRYFLGSVLDITERKQVENQLAERLDDLRRWHEITLGRETRILELKREVNELLRRLNEPIRHPSAEDPEGLR